MSWEYNQSTGLLSRDGAAIWTGYSGHGEGLNNPSMEQVSGVGPIPRGHWTIGAPRDGGHLGPYVMPLTPDSDTAAFGRSGFFIHGDNYHMDKSASHGCVVLPYQIRELIHDSSDNDLVVVSGCDERSN